MFDAKTLKYDTGTELVSVFDFDTDFLMDNNINDTIIDDICEKLKLYFNYINTIDDRNAIGQFRNNLVDLIWNFAYDEFEDNESFLTLAKCTEPDLIDSVNGCLNFVIENHY